MPFDHDQRIQILLERCRDCPESEQAEYDRSELALLEDAGRLRVQRNEFEVEEVIVDDYGHCSQESFLPVQVSPVDRPLEIIIDEEKEGRRRHISAKGEPFAVINLLETFLRAA
jgi:hypothetical protein